MEMSKINFKENLKSLMIEKHIKNVDLAKSIGLNRSTITLYLNGQRMPTYEILERLTIFFECSYDDLLKWLMKDIVWFTI